MSLRHELGLHRAQASSLGLCVSVEDGPLLWKEAIYFLLPRTW